MKTEKERELYHMYLLSRLEQMGFSMDPEKDAERQVNSVRKYLHDRYACSDEDILPYREHVRAYINRFGSQELVDFIDGTMSNRYAPGKQELMEMIGRAAAESPALEDLMERS